MFHHIRGELVQREASSVVIDCHGVGYLMTVSLNTSTALEGSMGSTVKLFAHLQVREDGVELFGFYSTEELACFKLLIGVSGVGPKAAMAILSLLTPEKFAFVVCNEDAKALAKAPGIGAKTAARIVLELHDKLAKDTAIRPLTGDVGVITNTSAAGPRDNGKLSEATDALTVLGYSRSEILDILRKLDTSAMSLEEIITAALKQFAKS